MQSGDLLNPIPSTSNLQISGQIRDKFPAGLDARNEKTRRPQGFREAPLPGFEPGFPD
jgi:hypothetical protein